MYIQNKKWKILKDQLKTQINKAFGNVHDQLKFFEDRLINIQDNINSNDQSDSLYLSV